MSLAMRRMFLCLIGLIAGLAVWPIAETAIKFQANFNSYLFFSIFLGLVFGLFMGGFFGTSEGITLSIKRRILTGIVTGAIIGILGGIVGFLIGQAALFLLGEIFVSSSTFKTIGFPVARSIGWAFLGIFIGMVEGIRAKSRIKIKTGILGGFLGGLVGGLALEYMRLLIDDIMIARMVGLLIFGLFIGLFYSIVESKLSAGVFRVLNGRSKGKEFILNQRRVKIGKSAKNDIVINAYSNVLDEHAMLIIKEHKNDKEVSIKSLNATFPVIVNDVKKDNHTLTINDVVQIGTAKFLYRFI